MPAMLASPPPASGRLYLTNARLFDGTGAAPRDGAAVLVDDGVIARVGASGDAVPEGARVIDLAGKMLLPGLTDCHVHARGKAPRVDKGAEEILPATPGHFLQALLRQALRLGVTTIRDVGAAGRQPQEARQAMRYGAFRGPRLLTCAKIISATAAGGRFYGDMYREVDGCDDVRRAVREQLRNGADFIKVMTTGARSNEMESPGPAQFTGAEFEAIVEESHRLGVRVAAHAEGLAGVEAAIVLGMDTIEHGMYLNQRRDLLNQMAARGQFLVPTLTGYYWVAGLGDAIDPSGVETEPEFMPMLVELANHNLDQGAKSLRAAREEGVRIALGSDGEVGANVGREVVRMIFHGLTPKEALVAATGTAAEALGIDPLVGTVTTGKIADLVVFDGDPLVTSELLLDSGKVWLVLQGGEPVAGSALERTL
jgi:imidazolonepropionase-like amidohydrolase